jgi:predicted solute-binding protein
MTGLPMVFAVWAGRPASVTPDLAASFADSCRFGLEHLGDIIKLEAAKRNLGLQLVRDYLTRNVIFELGAKEYEGLDLFLRYAGQFDRLVYDHT